jgi:uncharacterized protein (DUF1810 family)
MDDPYDLQRFVDAQDAGGTYDTVVGELREGRKETHWMWFVFPQIVGLGHSPIAQHYAISGLAEAKAYLGHPVLGPRLAECARVINELLGSDAAAILGPIDARKLRSSMTLFSRADPDEPVFSRVLDRYFAGQEDDGTITRL